MKLRILLLLLFLPIISFCQEIITDENRNLIEVWQTEEPIDYQGVYHFGFSEIETDFQLIYTDGKWQGQITRGEWKEYGDQAKWEYVKEKVDNIRIEVDKFYSDKGNGEFTFYNSPEGKQKGLMLYQSYFFEGESEFGPFIRGIKETDR